jgi:hypothetical protein
MSTFKNDSDGDRHNRKLPYSSHFEVDRSDGRPPLHFLGNIATRYRRHRDRIPAFIAGRAFTEGAGVY